MVELFKIGSVQFKKHPVFSKFCPRNAKFHVSYSVFWVWLVGEKGCGLRTFGRSVKNIFKFPFFKPTSNFVDSKL